MAGFSNKKTKFLLVAIILLAVSLRIWEIDFGLPYIYHPDEPTTVNKALNVFVPRSGSLDPKFYHWGSLTFYIHALSYFPYYFFGKLFGVFDNPEDIPRPKVLALAVGKTSYPSMWLLGRVLTVLFSVASVLLVFLIGKKITNNASIGLLASLMMAISPTNVGLSRYIAPDPILVFFLLLSILGSALVLRQGKTWHYILASVASGFAAAVKYPGGLVIIAMIVAHFIRTGKKGIKEHRLYLCILLCGIAFFVAMPYSILDYQNFLKGLQYDSQHYSTGHPGFEGNTLSWYLTYLWNVEGVVFLFALFGILLGIYKNSKEILVIAIFPAVYFLLISSAIVRFDRILMPILPFLFLLTSFFLLNLQEFLNNIRNHRWYIFTTAIFVVVSFTVPLIQTMKNAFWLTYNTTPESMRVFVGNNELFYRLLTVTPILFLFTALVLLSMLISICSIRRDKFKKAVIGALIILSLIIPFTQTMKSAIKLHYFDSHETAREWIDNNLPNGSRIVIESYTPYIDPKRFSVTAYFSMTEHKPEWYIEKEVDYLVFSEGTFGRFYQQPERYSKKMAEYENLFNSFSLVREFKEGEYKILIYGDSNQTLAETSSHSLVFGR